MAWVRLDDDFYLHPKLVLAGPLALAMQVAGLCYSNHYKTRGFISYSVADRLLDLSDYATIPDMDDGSDPHVSAWRVVAIDVANLLVSAGIWTVNEERCGYDIHDYAEYQPEVKAAELHDVRAAAGRAGGLAKAKQFPSRAKQVLAKPSPVPVPDPLAAAAACEDNPGLKAVCAAYENEIGTIGNSVGGDIVDELDQGTPADWIVKAIAEAARSNKRSWKYVAGILRRYKTEGPADRRTDESAASVVARDWAERTA